MKKMINTYFIEKIRDNFPFSLTNDQETAINKVKAKIPGLSKQLAPVSNTLGKDIKKYGRVFLLFLNRKG